MNDLSPAAQAVLDAFLNTPGEEPMPGWDYGRDLAAALQAVADQVAPSQQDYDEASHKFATVCLNGMTYVANELRAIAAELKAINE